MRFFWDALLDLEEDEVTAIVRNVGKLKLHRTTRRHIPEYFNLQQRTVTGDSEVPVPPPVTTAERVRRHPSVPQTRYELLAPGVSALSARCL